MSLSRVGDLFESIARWADRHSPQTLFARALIIIVVPMLLLQALSAWWFYSQRGDNVTNRLALILVRDLRTLISLRADFPDDEHKSWVVRHARSDLLIFVAFHPGTVRPFRPPEYFDIVARELLLRIQSVLRRGRPAEMPVEAERVVRFGPLQFDLDLGELTQKGKRVALTDAEIALLRALTARLGEVLSRELLCKSVGADVNERAIDVQVTRLRRKIEPDPGFPRYLRTVRGQGYRLVDA